VRVARIGLWVVEVPSASIFSKMDTAAHPKVFQVAGK